ncbi:ATP-dependent Clp protease adaptor ClpS [Saccharicrinis aurantiacus]|uniref:ATP-dependent Clp protease adaptor ClpS n=1 Tax=Saccharicrinis aurantiacus TaxID=1849719 RepID=UPI00094F4D9C|nr:ATP-dependent Clp protease adaptor ClpS [Saccharicrinis aurantiacus]
MEPFNDEEKQEPVMGDTNQNALLLINDDVNSFDDVIDALCEVCDHNIEQAEQCALIVHNKGEYRVMSGSLDELISIKHTLESKNLNVKIEAL